LRLWLGRPLLATSLRCRIDELSVMVRLFEMPFAFGLDQAGHLFCFQEHGFDSTTDSYSRRLGSVTDSTCHELLRGADSMIDFAFSIALRVSVVMFRRSIGANSRPASPFLNSSVLVSVQSVPPSRAS
jgi:hypothetical protein